MSVEIVPYGAEASLDWIAVGDAIAAGHDLPRAEVRDVILRRGEDTMLNRSAWIEGLGLAVKVATVFPGNAAAGKPSVGGSVTLYDGSDGALEAVVDFHLVTKWKTAADSLLAARRLARADSREILIVGAGAVARSLVEAYAAAFPGARFTVWNRTPERAAQFAMQVEGMSVAEDLAGAVGRADIVTCATMATAPVIEGAWLRPGTHVDLIGAYRPDMREADDEAMRRARVFVDARGTTVGHIGELIAPMETGVMTEADIVADFYDGAAFARTRDDEITLFKNGGGAHLDLMVARHILDMWRAR